MVENKRLNPSVPTNLVNKKTKRDWTNPYNQINPHGTDKGKIEKHRVIEMIY
jgi:hypothetical protein